VFRKLGVKSRTQLASRLGCAPTQPSPVGRPTRCHDRSRLTLATVG
jgi:hypothetical protein